MLGTNLIDNLFRRQIDTTYNLDFRNSYVFSKNSIDHLNLETELKGHEGCVNCLEWNQSGTLLASGSDDLKLNIWNPFQQKLVKSIDTKHRSNIFSVKFLMGTNDSLIASGAADRNIYVYDLNKNLYLNEIHSHQNRVKRLATANDIPFIFWSCSEDGQILQHDIRCASNEISKLLIGYPQMEAKCLAINQAKSELIAVGSNDPYARVYDRRMIKLENISNRTSQGTSHAGSRFDYSSTSTKHLFEFSLANDSDIPITYYTPGHLPMRIIEYRKRMKTLSVTFLSFSPDGKELLVNLGGEQLYLYDLKSSENSSSAVFKYDSFKENLRNIDAESFESNENENSIQDRDQLKKKKYKLSPKAEELKAKANACFELANYLEAIEYYNLAIQVAPDSPILYGNRAASLMKRNWDGDFYMAMLDCYKALSLDKMHLKSHFRLVRCLYELKWVKEAKECLDIFIDRFPEYANSNACDSLANEIEEALFKLEEKSKNKKDESETSNSDSDNEYDHFLTKRKKSNTSKSGSDKSNEDDELDEDVSNERRKVRLLRKRYQHAKEKAIDIKQRYCGHCNVSTDIKEACFLGLNYISAGSDDGSFFIWNKSTTNVERVLRGDESIVNCIQPHPFENMIATSGIDPYVRIWTPQLDEEKLDERDSERVVTDIKEAALNNQRQMNSHPFEFLLLNLAQSQNDESQGGNQDDNRTCRAS